MTANSNSDSDLDSGTDAESESNDMFRSSVTGFEVEVPCSASEVLFPDVLVGLEVKLLAPGDGIMTDRHDAAPERYQAGNPMNQIGGVISPFPLSGWGRHGCERLVQDAGGTACHPGEPNADYRREAVYERDLENGYHEKGSCVPGDGDEPGCVIHELFGGFGDKPGELLRRPISFSPVRRQVDVRKGEAEAHYRQLSNQVRSRNEGDGGQPLRYTDRDMLANVEGTWRLTLRSVEPEFVGLLLEAVSLLNTRSTDFELQLGGARNFGGGIADCWVLNPLYSDAEVRRVFNRARNPTVAMDEKDEVWRRECRDEFVHALQRRLQHDAEKMGVPESQIVGGSTTVTGNDSADDGDDGDDGNDGDGDGDGGDDVDADEAARSTVGYGNGDGVAASGGDGS